VSQNVSPRTVWRELLVVRRVHCGMCWARVIFGKYPTRSISTLGAGKGGGGGGA